MAAENCISINKASPSERASTAARRNRNLSSVISTIQDDGPASVVGPVPLQNTVEGVFSATGKRGMMGQTSRIRALPGIAVMLKVVGILVLVAILGGVGLLASGRYPVLDTQGLQLAPLPAGWLARVEQIKSGMQDIMAAWSGGTGQRVADQPLPATDGEITESVAFMTVAARQQQILARLDVLAADVDALGARVDRDATGKVMSDISRQTEQALQIIAIQGQLAELRERLDSSLTRTEENKSPTEQSAAVAPAPAGPVTGGWVVYVASSSRQGSIKALQEELLRQDIVTELQQMDAQGAPRYRLRVTGFTTGGEARRYAGRLEREHGLEGAWASKR